MDVVRVPLTRGMVALVDADVWESDRTCHRFDGSMSITVRPSAIRWSAQINRRFYYAQHAAKIDGRTVVVTLHRLLSQCPAGMVVDHANGDTMDNRLANLRCCGNRENARNEGPRGGTSKYRGVYFDRRARSNPWRAQIGFRENGKVRVIALGSFATEEQAATARDLKARELFGAFARLNFAEAAQ